MTSAGSRDGIRSVPATLARHLLDRCFVPSHRFRLRGWTREEATKYSGPVQQRQEEKRSRRYPPNLGFFRSFGRHTRQRNEERGTGAEPSTAPTQAGRVEVSQGWPQLACCVSCASFCNTCCVIIHILASVGLQSDHRGLPLLSRCSQCGIAYNEGLVFWEKCAPLSTSPSAARFHSYGRG